MIEPIQSNDALLRDIETARQDSSRAHLWWLGQSGFLLQARGKHFLFDPYLSDSLTRKYAGTDKPHERMTRQVIAPERLDFIDVVSSSHIHTDHLDAETLRPLIDANKKITIVFPEANRSTVRERLGDYWEKCGRTGIDAGQTIDIEGFRVSAVPAAHNTVERDDAGRCKFIGIVVQIDEWTIYHSGDTLWHDGLVDALRPFDIAVAILPINGNKPERRVAGNLDGCEAAKLAHSIGAKLVVPCHYEMFSFNTASPDVFTETCRDLGQQHAVLKAGQRIDF